MNKEKFSKFKNALDRQEYDHTAHDGESVTMVKAMSLTSINMQNEYDKE